MTGWILAAVLAGSCRPVVPERAKLGSERAANDFSRLVKSGRKVTQAQALNASGTSLALSQSQTIAGYQAINVEQSKDGRAILFAQFDARQTPAVKETQLDTFARDFLRRVAGELTIDPAEMKSFPINSASPSQKIIAWTREIGGVAVRDSRLALVFAQLPDGFHLIEIRNRAYGHITPQKRPDGERLNEARLAQVIRTTDIKVAASGDYYILETLKGTDRLFPATWYTITTSDGQTFTLTFTGGNEPRLLEAYSHRVETTVEAMVYPRAWTDTPRSEPIGEIAIDTPQGRLTLDVNGQTQSAPPTGKVTIRNSWFSGQQASGGAPSFDVRPEGGKSSIVTANGDPSTIINVYAALRRIRSYAARFYLARELPYMSKKLSITTDIARECNAFYQSMTLSFYSRGGRCANMAYVNDVIYHEWGHGLDDHTGPGAQHGGGMTDAAFSEGIGDIVAMFMSGDHNMGVGFFTASPQSPIRKLDNQKVYVPGEESEIHDQGTIIGGAFWELRRRMVNKYGAAGHDKAAGLFFRHLLEAESYKDSYGIVQRLSDDDQNPATRHSDWCLINHAFAQKALTAKDPCADGYNDASSDSATRVFVALGDPASAGTPLFVSTSLDAAHSVRVCAGRELCQQPATPTLIKSEGGIKFFGNVNWSPAHDQIISIHVFDSNGQLLAKRIAKLTKR